MAEVFAASAWLALAPVFDTPKEKLARSGLALIVASALTLIVLFVDLDVERESQAVVRPITSSAIAARTRMERFIVNPPRCRLKTY